VQVRRIVFLYDEQPLLRRSIIPYSNLIFSFPFSLGLAIM